jgi:DNA-binding LacI/PurR family transcriptional regulator
MARRAMTELLVEYPEIDGVVVANNLMAIGVMEAIAAAGLTVPDDVALVGIDDPLWASLVAPPLTALGQPTQQMASRAFDLLLDRIAEKRTSTRFEVFHFHLHVRESCGSGRSVSQVAG